MAVRPVFAGAFNRNQVAVIDGKASKLSGGSFANGATTAAFQQLFGDGLKASRSGDGDTMAATVYTKDRVPYTEDVPGALQALMTKYPDLEKMMERTMQKSYVGRNKEHGFVAYEISGVCEKLGTLFYQEFTDGLCCTVNMNVEYGLSFARPVVNFHSHPFSPSHHSIAGIFGYIGYGPSTMDFNASKLNPTVFYVAQDVEKRYFFGPRSK
jgi:hypothetical protein